MQTRTRQALLALTLAPGTAIGQAAPAGSLPGASIDAGKLLGLAGSLALVVAAILFAGWAYSRLRGMSSGPCSLISVLATRPLGPKERIVLVQIGDTQLALGMTQSSVNTLHVFERHVIDAPETQAITPFAKKLRTAFKGKLSR